MEKRVAIMQPYFLPYIGYFHLVNSVDEFVIYDNIQYTKKGWINRNRILVNGSVKTITLPLKKGSDYLDVGDRYLASSWEQDREKLLNIIKQNYQKAPYFSTVYPLIQECINVSETNLFKFILNTLNKLNSYLDISTKITTSSTLNIDHSLKSQSKVIAICRELNASTYVNAIGGQGLYKVQDFEDEGLALKFVKSPPLLYKQYKNEFIPWLSVLDVVMFNEKQAIINYTNDYTLI
jgi:hypothetical protein|tara:strand:+ start:975 stop:1682 length:708 start_codon:yes stop_codon:yes gene_type:complete